ncbi:MAG: rod shape-determining protein MreC [Methylacidiphilales bacterium]|nr:rod shape-determining protein MreC [Candidatus Methylacidiphilales bacterium]
MNKSTSFLLVLGILLAFIVSLLLVPEPFTRPLRKHTLEVLGPVLSTLEAPVHFFTRVNSKLTTLDQAQAEVERQKKEIAELELRNQLLSDKEKENARLREMLGFQADSKYELLPCRVVSREPSNWWDSVQINVGWENNAELDKKYQGKYSLTSDQPVVSPRGVVGKTGNVSRYVTDVILLVNENCSISATIDGTHDQGIVKGQGNFEEGEPRVMIHYLPKTSTVAVGQFVVTSGLGPYFPAGLRLGTVTEVPPLNNQYPTFGLYRQAVIEPTADLNQLDALFIVLGPKQQTKEPQ